MILNTYKAKDLEEGAGVHVHRVFGHDAVEAFDPFLMLDYFCIDPPMTGGGFPWHPHKGIETISYLLRGAIDHQDSLGNKGTIGPGDLQWMTAGQGIKHQEMPVKSEQGLEGFQFWLNLPRHKKGVAAHYQYMTKETVVTFESALYSIKIISGCFENLRGPIDKSDLGVDLFHVKNQGDSGLVLTRALEKSGFIFVWSGQGFINNEPVEAMTAYTLEPGPYTIQGDMAFIFAQAKPLREPIAWYGPIVMNTQEELRAAFKALEDGTF